ncbi:MAG: phenylalanine--tRNA ligase subunit beta [Bacteroidales bacterium]|jgi:phenylalanyl-tRNA synthetase beta chain|nr:phenylalanine--tRNA ligase subunit beta [Bacteroidales bacterium]
MKISYNWLKEYIVKTNDNTPLQLDANEAARNLTFAGLEVESVEVVESIKGGLQNYYVGLVISCVPHPNSDHLHLTQVEVGFEQPLNIVCGASNVATGQKVIVATVGAKVYTGEEDYFEIKKTKLRGAESEGMICSEKELGISDNHDGIMVLPDSAIVGQAAKDYFNITEDSIFEIGLTPNRSDAASHIGVARDLVAVLNAQCGERKYKINYPSVDNFQTDSNDYKIDIQIDEKLCRRYAAVIVSGVKIAPSPEWLQNHLRAIGLKPVNNVVDITNYVLMETGQPLHAFDFDKVIGKEISVKTLPAKTSFTTLDGIVRELNGNEAMVCNSTEAMCMGGIYGGQHSGIGNNTTDVLIESACFNPVIIRKASKYHNLHTDASFRFERGSDINIVPYALKRAALLMKELAGGKIASDTVDVYPEKVEETKVYLDYSYMDNLIGKKIDRKTIKLILTSLEINIESETPEGLRVNVPSNKVDVTRPCDVVEEVLRIYGYNNVEITQDVKSSLTYTAKPDRDKIRNIISDLLVASGFNETMNNSLSKVAYYDNNQAFPQAQSVNVLNALSKDLGVMRQTLLYGGMEVIAYNINRKTNNIRTFEFGNCYKKNLETFADSNILKRYDEQQHLAIFVTGNLQEENWQMKPQKADFFYLKNAVMNVLQRLRIDLGRFNSEKVTADYFEEGLQLINRDNGKIYVQFGKLKTNVCKAFDVKQEVYYADFAWDLLIKTLPKKEIKYQEVVKFPEVRRDLALVVDKAISFKDIETVAYQYEKQLLRNIYLFDVYEGEKLESGKKQYAISFILQDKDKTLTDKQIEAIMNKLLKGFEKELGAKLR